MLKGKTIIITGSNRGIGLAMLNLFSENRASIYACSRIKDKIFIDHCKKLENENNCNIYNIFFDFKDNDDVKKAAKEIVNQCNNIDILINNAGLLKVSSFQMTRIQSIKDIFEVNFFSQLQFSQIIINRMIKNNSGNIINISSTSGIKGDEGRLGYSASKSALITASKVLSKELASFNIRVNTIAPGLINTDMLINNTKPEIINEVKNKLMNKRIAEPIEVAEVALFLASDSSSYITGQTLRVDGGLI